METLSNKIKQRHRDNDVYSVHQIEQLCLLVADSLACKIQTGYRRLTDGLYTINAKDLPARDLKFRHLVSAVGSPALRRWDPIFPGLCAGNW